MNRRLSIVALAAAGLAWPAAAQAATEVARGQLPAALVDREGTTHLVFNEARPETGPTDRLHYCRIPRGAGTCADLRAFEPFPGDDTYDVWGPGVAVTPFGEVLLVTHRVNVGNVVYTSEDDGVTFTGPRVVGTVAPGDPAAPARPVLDAADRRLVTIGGSGGGRPTVQGAPLEGGPAGTAVLDTAGSVHRSIVQRGRGSFAAAWALNDGSVRIRTFDCAECPVAAINDASRWTPAAAVGDARHPRLASGPSGTLLLTQRGDGAWEVRRLDGASPGPPVTAAAGRAPWADLAADPGGGLALVHGDGDNGLSLTRSADGGAWSGRQVLQPGPDFTIQHPTALARTTEAGTVGQAIWTRQEGGVTNPPILLQVFPAPEPPPAPPTPPPAAAPAPPTPEAPPAACRLLSFGPVDAIADACFTLRDGVASARGLRLNGLRLDGATVRLVTRGDRRITSEGSVTVKLGDTVLFRGRLDWPLPDTGSVAELPGISSAAFGGRLLGFPLAGNATLRLRRGASEAGLVVGLPAIFGGVTGAVTVRADNLAGVRLRELRVRVGAALLGPVLVRDLRFDYDADGDRWAGGAELVLPPQPPGPSLRAQVAFARGALESLGAELRLPGPGLALDPFAAVYLRTIRFSLGTDPLRLHGGLTITAGPTIDRVAALGVDGDFTLTLPTGAPASLRAEGRVSIVDVPLQRAYFELRTDGYVTFGGGLRFPERWETPLVQAQLDGWMHGRRFNAQAAARICLGDLGCAAGEAVVSSEGFGACARTPIADFGGGYRWGEGLDLMFTGCDIGPFSAAQPRAAQASTDGFTLPAGLRAAVVGVHGRGAAPHVALVGPGGLRVLAPADGPLRTPDAIGFHQEATTYYVLRRPAAGRWRIEPQPGSAPVERVRTAQALPEPRVRATVRRRGVRRELRYSVSPLPGQTVRFAEEGARVARDLGAARGAGGRRRFTPADGPGGTRRIVATVSQHGVPRARLVVARYRAPAQRRPAAPRITRARGGRVAWSAVRGARRWRVRVTDRRGAVRLRILPARTRHLAVARGSRVEVVGLRADGVAGRPRRTTVR